MLCDLCAVGARQTQKNMEFQRERETKSDIFVVFELFGMGRNGQERKRNGFFDFWMVGECSGRAAEGF